MSESVFAAVDNTGSFVGGGIFASACILSRAAEFPPPGLLPKKAWFYMSGLITYGKGHFTRFCVEYTVTPPTHSDEACEDPNTNNAN